MKIPQGIENFIKIKIQQNSRFTPERLKEKINKTYRLAASI